MCNVNGITQVLLQQHIKSDLQQICCQRKTLKYEPDCMNKLRILHENFRTALTNSLFIELNKH